MNAVTMPKGAPVIPFPQRAGRMGGTTIPARPMNDIPRVTRPPATPPTPSSGSQDLSDMEIPTFIRRQMD